jgi:hypothetical protein
MQSDNLEFPIAFGKVTYAPGAPKNAPRWTWACQCAECANRAEPQLHGPFNTLKEAERHAVRTIREITDGWDGLRH